MSLPTSDSVLAILAAFGPTLEPLALFLPGLVLAVVILGSATLELPRRAPARVSRSRRQTVLVGGAVGLVALAFAGAASAATTAFGVLRH